MDFELTEEQQMLVKMAKDMSEKQIGRASCRERV